jgi:hypothetical protein
VERLKASASRVAKLEAENQALRQEVLHLRIRAEQGQVSRHGDQLLDSNATFTDRERPEQATAPARSSTTAGKIFRVSNILDQPRSSKTPDIDATGGNVKLLEKYRITKESYKQAEALLRDMVEERNMWMERAIRREKKKTSVLNTASSGMALHDSPIRLAEAKISTESEGQGSSPPKLVPSVERDTEAPCADQPPEPRGDVVSTARGFESALPVSKRGSSPELPVVVSERSIRKRKAVDDIPIGQQEARQVKAENNSSDPIFIADIPHFRPQESFDLDDHSPVVTPEKALAVLGDDNRQGEGADDAVEDVPHQRRAPESNRTAEVGSMTAQGAAPPQHERRQPLGPVSGNILTKKQDDARKRRAPWKLGPEFDSLTGDAIPGGMRRSFNVGSASPKSGLLDDLLNGPSPRIEQPLKNPRQLRRSLIADGLPAAREVPPLTHKTPNTVGLAVQGDLGAVLTLKSAKAVQPQVRTSFQGNQSNPATPIAGGAIKSLRQTPLARLGISDFKVNPRYSDGQQYAFADVVRDKVGREELAPCTDPGCCGSTFRSMAESELDASENAAIRDFASVKMMENWLGDEAYRLGSLNLEEKREVWLRAKTLELAKRHGKHKHRHQRWRSPPGYWNTDFPSTQENVKNLEEADKMQRQAVEHRWREAMREGGRWLFRDE